MAAKPRFSRVRQRFSFSRLGPALCRAPALHQPDWLGFFKALAHLLVRKLRRDRWTVAFASIASASSPSDNQQRSQNAQARSRIAERPRDLQSHFNRRNGFVPCDARARRGRARRVQQAERFILRALARSALGDRLARPAECSDSNRHGRRRFPLGPPPNESPRAIHATPPFPKWPLEWWQGLLLRSANLTSRRN